jgi:hypothetical protein
MKRRTLDLIFSVGGTVLAVLLFVLGLVLMNQANFAKDYVHNQLAAQRITFTPVAGLSDQEKQSSCLVANAGQPMSSGSQAECYANHYIALHLSEVNDGKTYAQTSTQARAARSAADAAAKANAPNAKQLDAAATALESQVQTLFRGETLRGLLLTSYGFSIFGDRAETAAWVCFGIAFVLLLASIAGFVHAFRASKAEAFAPVEPTSEAPHPATV